MFYKVNKSPCNYYDVANYWNFEQASLYGQNKFTLTKESHKFTINSSLSICARFFL